MTKGSWVMDDLSAHKKSCAQCRVAIDAVKSPPWIVDLVKLCALGRGYYRAWWEWAHERAYPRGVA